MDGIRKLAHRGFPVPEIGSYSRRKYPDLERIQIRIDASGSTIMELTKESNQSYINRLYRMTPYDESTNKATFELVHITRDKAGDPPNIAPEVYRCLSQNQGWIDHFILDILHYKNYGFYHVSEEASTNQVHTFLISSVLYTLLWTYHAPTATTKGMLVSRSCAIVGRSTVIYDGFLALLRSYQDLIYEPSLLVFISSAHLISVIDRCLVEVRDTIRRIESRSGHGGWHNQKPDMRSTSKMVTLEANWDNTMACSKWAAECTTTLVNLERQVELADVLNSFMIKDSDGCFAKDNSWGQNIKDSLKLATNVLQNRVIHAKPNVSYLHERARTQSAVLLALLTHEDSLTNIELARVNRDIAEAAKRDSSAMKTIAIMTMLFLPATFYAALFGMPSFNWEKPGVIQTKFWLYWAFAIPTTVLVFFVWAVMNNWNLIWHHILKYSTALRPIWEFCLGASMVVAYTDQGYLRDAYLLESGFGGAEC